MATNKPADISSKIWAALGDVETPTDVKMETGWVAEVPKAQVENWVQNRQDAFNAHVNERGIAEWDATTDYIANKSYVQDSSGTVYRAVQNTGPSTIVQNPTTDGTNTYWAVAFAGGSLDVYTKGQSDARFVKNSDLPDASAIPGRLNALEQFDEDLAAAGDPGKGAQMVAWFSSLTGAVSRWVSEKLSDQLSFKDFGIVGDESDETAKLQAAFAASAGKLLKAEPDKIYVVTDELLIPSNATVDFCGSTLRYTINVDGKSCLRFKNVQNSELRNVVIEPVGTMVVAPHTGDSRMPVVVGEYIGHPANMVCQNIRISNVKVIGGFPAMNAIVVMGQAENIIIENPVIEGTSEPASAGIGILVHWSTDNYDTPTKTYHPRNVKVVNPRFRKCALGATAEQASCIFISGAFNVRVENIDAYDVNTGVYVYPGDYGFAYASDLAASQVRGIVIDGGVIVGSRKFGVNILGQADGVGPILPMGVRINGLRTDGVDAAIRVRRSGAGVVIDGSSPHHATVGVLVSESADVTAVNCDVTYNAQQGVYFTGSSRCILASSRISFNNTEGLSNQLGSAVYLDSACSGNFIVGNAIGDEAATEYYGVRINGSTVKRTTISDNVFGNFTTNVAIQNDANPYAVMTSGSGNVFAGSSLLSIAATPPMVSYDSGGSATVRANAAPTTGTWNRGDRFINSVPTVGQPIAWVCTVGGTPGTWVSEGVLL